MLEEVKFTVQLTDHSSLTFEIVAIGIETNECQAAFLTQLHFGPLPRFGLQKYFLVVVSA